MKWFLNLKLARKLALAFGVSLALAVIMGVAALSRMAEINDATDRIAHGALARTALVSELDGDMRQFRLYEFNHLLDTSAAGMSEMEAKMRDTRSKIETALGAYEKLTVSEDDRKNIRSLGEAWKTYLARQERQAAFNRANDFKHGNALMKERKADFNVLSDGLNELREWNGQRAKTLSDQADEDYAHARLVVIGLLAAAVVFGTLSAAFVTRIVTNALGILSRSASALAAGDVQQEIAIDTKDEVGDLAQNFREMIRYQKEMAAAATVMAEGDFSAEIRTQGERDALGNAFRHMQTNLKGTAAAAAVMASGDFSVEIRPQSERDALGNAFRHMQVSLSELLAQTRAAADSIASASEQVAAGNADLSQRTEEQAASLEETAASMEEMTSTVKQNADNSGQANQLAAQAREVAEKGGQVVSEAVDAMGQISNQSKKVADIITVIDEIAFQTNLLALNAAVEAARVGEQGRGFAVVAGEVRALAARSASAAKEIKTLVGETVSRVEQGTELVNASGERLYEIVSSIKKVSDIVAEISAASIEQSAGIEQVNKAVLQMDQVTQQNAALVEESAAAATGMKDQARELQTLVSRFSIDEKYLTQVYTKQVAAPVVREATTGRPVNGAGTARRPQPKLQVVNTSDADEEFSEF